METLDEIREQIEALRKKMSALEEREFLDVHLPKMKELIGKTFKYRNCYSSPQSEADRWWMYVRVTGASESGLEAITIQKDCNGMIEAKNGDFVFYPLSDSYIPISMAEYLSAVSPLLLDIRNAAMPAGVGGAVTITG